MAREKGRFIRDIVPVLNSVFKTAKIEIQIVDLSFYKEEIVVGFPQVESLEREIQVVEEVGDCELGARYIVYANLLNKARIVSVYVRFYITSDGKLIIEDFGDNGVTLADPDEIKDKSGVWKQVLDYAIPWGPVIVKLALSYFNILDDVPS